ncbi:phosphotransferase family protein [Rhizohabitans arisaemae]|uniref:phosphotransferase family protein n=1 Tax=Rhizohabitans arisaemae TaxID=2720610 RepID=UPI0024B0BD4C|nr:phosphotransferase [Rhizohabitans arisaemae]
MTPTAELVTAMTRFADADGDPEILSTRSGAVVIRVGRVVVKAHRAETDGDVLTAQASIVRHEALRGVFAEPLALTRLGDRWISIWPAGRPVSPDDPDVAPWEHAARLLARLHTAPLPAVGRLPVSGGPVRVAQAVAGLPPGAVAEKEITAAYAGLPDWARDRAPVPVAGRLAHGDWHLGQLVHLDGTGWRLIDIDDVGTGDPAWDLARPAAFYAAGLLAPEVWARFLDAYREAGGCAIPPDGDPWPALDVPAKAMTVQLAAFAVTKTHEDNRPLDEIQELFVDACRRISGLHHLR